VKVYFDNAATTPIEPEVLDAMVPVMKDFYGNPSSIHSFGRQTRAFIENSRKTIARLLNVSPSEIFFTSGGTEADNQAIFCSVRDLGLKHAISSKIEHHAVLHTLEALEKQGRIELSFVKLKANGHIDLDHLEDLLKEKGRSLVSLMHANNEIGNLLPMKAVGLLCEKYNSVFHSDTVQTMAHYAMDLQANKVHYVTCGAHKFHGPKGVGFLYVNSAIHTGPFIYGGSQERNRRGGTENVHGIVGLAKAMEIAHRDMAAHQQQITEIKKYMMQRLESAIPDIAYNGDAGGSSLYTILNVLFPANPQAEMMLFNLDIDGIAASGGSACTSGSNQGSHVLRAIGSDQSRPSVRFSFSKYSSKAEVDYCLNSLMKMYPMPVAK